MESKTRQILREDTDKTITCKKCGKDNTLKLSESLTRNDINSYLLDFGYFITLNLSKVQSEAIDQNAQIALKKMQERLRAPIINGKTFIDITDLNKTLKSELFKPEFIKGVLTQVRAFLPYIKQHIERFVKDGHYKTAWLLRIDNLEKGYINIVNQPKPLNEHLQQADKIYFNTGKLSPKVRETILKITGGDAFTKLVTDMYFAKINEDHEMGDWAVSHISGKEEKTPIENDVMGVEGWQKIKKAYEQLKTYNKNVFPIEGLNNNSSNDALMVMYALDMREAVIKEMKNLPTVAARNLRAEIRQPRTLSELNQYRHNLEYFNAYYSQLSNRDEKQRKKIEDKMFKSNTTLDDLIDFASEKSNMIGGEKFTKNKVKNLLDNYHGELEVVYDKGNIMVVEVAGPQGIKDIGCNSLWCFTYGSGFEAAYRQWSTYSTNGLVYVIIDFSEQPDSEYFMYVLIKPLEYENQNSDDDDDNFGGDSPLYDMSNQQVHDPLGVINQLIGLDASKKIFTFGEEPVKAPPAKKPEFVDPNQLSLFESIRRKVLKEYLSQDMVSLYQYFKTSREDREKYLPYEYPYQFDQFAIEYKLQDLKDKFEEEGIETYEIPDILESEHPEVLEQFGKWLYMMIEDGDLGENKADYPTWYFFDNAEIVKNQWLIHFTNDADSIAIEGFTRGVNEMDKLGLTTNFGDFYKKYGGYNFAYKVEDYAKYAHSNRSFGGYKFKYGKEAVIFNASGLRLWHHGDEEPQVIFFGNTAKNIIPIVEGENSTWSVRNAKTNRVIFENDNFDKVVQWVVNNFIQYKNSL
jgi:hypothetical protein